MKLRKFTNQGLEEFINILLIVEGTTSTPDQLSSLLISPAHTDIISPEIEVEKKTFGSRLKAAEYLRDTIRGAEMEEDLLQDGSLWAWLSALYFEELCSRGRGGVMKPGDVSRWIPDSDYRNYYRHLLRGPYSTLETCHDSPHDAALLLYQPLSKPGDFYEQLAARQEFITNPAIVKTATALYFDFEAGMHKRGAQSRKRKGHHRRFIAILDQFDLTYDLYSLSAESLIDMLPAEFDRWKSKVNGHGK